MLSQVSICRCVCAGSKRLSPLFHNFLTDVMHFSVPCKFWSVAHTGAGKDDHENKSLLFEIPKMIRDIRPRQVCIEQVDGLVVLTKHRSYFKTLIRRIHSIGYTVAWKVFNLAEYGLPAQRRRLIIFASAPGEPLPRFPTPTHGPNTLQPFVTVRQALQDIAKSDKHNQHSQAIPPNQAFRADPDKPLHATLICGRRMTIKRGQKSLTLCQPNGREFTIRHLARFQTFPGLCFKRLRYRDC
ncbi:S-adenosyl-L-methionine-dependent methyltransferase [Tothia fuscella]|uniref:DNA (cytosine-5-)-methyltransferase n=1 Tax=Tothia fuscella TaxID=1048955 RepID=A0A9P4NH09_9PEZI|nr:S-adenosyl-L-methionine-dependent methyltransferase [Tothia fuscella]